MKKSRKKIKSFKWILWLGLGALIAFFSFWFSVKSYLISMNKQEVVIAQVATSGRNPTNLTNLPAGKLKVYVIGGYVNQVQANFNFGGKSESLLVSKGVSAAKETVTVAEEGSSASLIVLVNGVSYRDWISPEDSRCTAESAALNYGIIKGSGEKIVVAQCWDDDGIGQFYNEMALVVTQGGSGSTTTPTITPESTYTYVGTTNEEVESKTSFVIRKFLDGNKDGVREVGEGVTNREWVYEYQINNGGKQIYSIEPGQEMGEEISVKKDDMVKVQEVGQEGWLNTTGAVIERSLREEKLHYFNFGGYPVNGVVPVVGTTTFPATQPSTGTPLWLTLGALGAGASLLVLKKKFR
jgi:hypothetical protein